jgi:mannose/fructose-specific phosphotransferase system component IIA
MRGLEGNFQAQPRVFAHDAVDITPNDGADIPNTSERGCCIYVGDISGGSNIKVTMESGNEITFTGVVAGSFLPILVKKVFSTGTTASGLIALY